MAEQKQKADESAGGVEAQAFFGAMAEAIKNATQQAVHAANPRRDNPNYEPDSDRAPKGVIKNSLTRRVIFKGIVQEETQLTPEEIDLFNQLPAQLEATITMAGLPRTVTVFQENKGSVPDLKIDFPLSIEERAYMPSLPRILRALISGASSVD